MKRSFLYVGLITTLLLAGPSARGQECEVGGLICSDTTWDYESCPDGYVVTSSIIVGCDATLTIEADVEVHFKSNLGLTVGHITFGDGTLVARGTEESPILFTSNAPYEGEPQEAEPGDWVNIFFTDYATDAEFDEFGDYVSGSTLEHVIVEYAGGGDPPGTVPAVKAENCSPYLAHCRVRNNSNKGISVTSSGAGDVKIQDCVVRDNHGIGGSAVSVNASGGGSVSIERCQVYDHGNIRGIAVTAGAFPAKIQDCEIARCSTNWYGGGIFLRNGTDHIVSGNLVEDCTVTATANWDHRYGGGIYINARTTVDSNIVRNNSVVATGYGANAYGGGLILDTSCDGSILSNNVVTGNTADSYNAARGGGIFLWNSVNCELTSNTVTGNYVDGPGGGIYLFGSGNCVLSDNRVTDNSTSGQWSCGGGIYLLDSTSCLLRDNGVSGNTTSGQNAHGGGICVQNSGTGTGNDRGLRGNTVSDNVITGNNAIAGGIFVWNSGNTILESNSITGNRVSGADGDAGGIGVWGSASCTLTGNTIAENTCGDAGGGLRFSNSGRWVLESNVITDNTAGGNAGGVYIGNSGCATKDDPRCTMTDTIVARNHTNGDTGGIYVYNSTWVSFAGDPLTCTYNCICDNDGYCVYNDNAFDPAGSGDIDARYVKWCTYDTQDIEDCIYDFFDDASLGIVVWYPFVAGDCENWDWPAWRDLSVPELAYRPEVPKTIYIQITPPDGAETILLEDKPPTGWTVSDISPPGSWDAVNELVKWAFLDAPFPAEVYYTVTPPGDADGKVCFAGTISIDGGNLGICGDKCIDRWHCPYIPADEPQDYCEGCGDCSCATCEDGRVKSCEVSGYACAWKKDCNDDLSGMTRAAYIWKSGECYCWDEAELNWFPTGTCPAPESGCCGDAGDVEALALTGGAATRQFRTQGAERNLPNCYSAGVDFDVTVTIDPPQGVLAVALEDQPPAGWTVGEMSDGCEWGSDTGKVKCGPYFDDPFPTEIHYTVTPPEDACGEACFTGTVSFDGINQGIDGDQCASLRGDVDCDHDVDLYDFAAWTYCMTGPDAGPYHPACKALDSECDGDIDLADFALFQEVFTGAQ